MTMISTLCHICGKPAKFTCKLCGKHVCESHYNATNGLCSSCSGGKKL